MIIIIFTVSLSPNSFRSTPTSLPAQPSKQSLYLLKTWSSVFVTQLLLDVGISLEWSQYTRGHTIQENWFSLSQKLLVVESCVHHPHSMLGFCLTRVCTGLVPSITITMSSLCAFSLSCPEDTIFLISTSHFWLLQFFFVFFP